MCLIFPQCDLHSFIPSFFHYLWFVSEYTLSTCLPHLVSRVVSSLTTAQDYNFKILPPTAFYPVYWSHVDGFFMGPKQVRRRWIEHKLEQLTDMTYGMHLWNKQSSRLTIEQGSIMQRLISEHCNICKHEYSSRDNISKY